jgi:hypothetical protein
VGAISTFDEDGITAEAGAPAFVVPHPAHKTAVNAAAAKAIFLSLLFIIEPPKIYLLPLLAISDS